MSSPELSRSVSYVFDRDQQPSDLAEVSADAALKEHGIGRLPLSLTKIDTGHEVGQLTVPVSGDWTLTVRVRTSAFDEYAASTRLPIK